MNSDLMKLKKDFMKLKKSFFTSKLESHDTSLKTSMEINGLTNKVDKLTSDFKSDINEFKSDTDLKFRYITKNKIDKIDVSNKDIETLKELSNTKEVLGEYFFKLLVDMIIYYTCHLDPDVTPKKY